ncbi:MAG: hypothetical protein ACE369_18015 [Roseovarius sp.]
MLFALSPEGQATATVVTCLAVAYFMLYPALRPRRVSRMALYDLGVTGVMLLVNGWLFLGSGTRFSLWLFDTNWVVFTILVALIIETPLMLWYVRRNGMDWD